MTTVEPSRHEVEFYSRYGYAIVDLLSESAHKRLEDLCCERIVDTANEELPGGYFDPRPLATYHQNPLITDQAHGKMMAASHRKLFPTADDQRLLANEGVFPFLDQNWGHHNFLFQDEASPGELVEGMCSFRVVRPDSRDASGIHCETTYPTLPPFPVTLWIPIVGFDEQYTLKLAPGSHLATHPPEAVERNDQYTAQAFPDDYWRQFEFVRPDIRRGQAIILHSNTLHCQSHNLGSSTRVSVEIRLREVGATF